MSYPFRKIRLFWKKKIILLVSLAICLSLSAPLPLPEPFESKLKMIPFYLLNTCVYFFKNKSILLYFLYNKKTNIKFRKLIFIKKYHLIYYIYIYIFKFYQSFPLYIHVYVHVCMYLLVEVQSKTLHFVSCTLILFMLNSSVSFCLSRLWYLCRGKKVIWKDLLWNYTIS